jgi:membrane-bound lytic murein transglycosylase D
LVLLGVVSAKAAPEVPSKMSYCGIEIHLDDSARSYMSNIVRQITRSPNYFKSLVTKVDMYMPFVEEAFQYAEVPQDLKYIVIMESSLQSDVVSSSNAVGFWQFKEASAREVGLVMNGQVDERMHIFRSSVGAARYFYRLNRDFDNWLYAVIAYNRGPAGAIPYVDSKYFGKKSMEVTGKTHGYGLKALAYKLIFQDELGKGMPTEWLEPRPTLGETSTCHLGRVQSHRCGNPEKVQPLDQGECLARPTRPRGVCAQARGARACAHASPARGFGPSASGWPRSRQAG